MQQQPPNWNDLALSRSLSDKDIVASSFPQQLMEVLSNEGLSDIITWLPHGLGWIILDKKRFAAEVLPKYFEKKSKWTSFTRKLNRWNFTRVTRGDEVGAYYHPFFQRGKKDLCAQMACMASKTPQSMEPLNPVALGLATPKMIEQGLLQGMIPGSHQFIHGSSFGMEQAQTPQDVTPMENDARSLRSETVFSDSLTTGRSNMPQHLIKVPSSSSRAFPSSGSSSTFASSEVSHQAQPTLHLGRKEGATDSPDSDFKAGDDSGALSPNPLAFHIDAYFRQQAQSAAAPITASRKSSSVRDRIIAEFHAKAAAAHGRFGQQLQRNTGFRLQQRRLEDTLTMTPTNTMIVPSTSDGRNLGLDSNPTCSQVDGSSTSLSQGGNEPPDEQQKISPSLFDSTSSDQSSEDGGNQYSMMSQQIQQQILQQLHRPQHHQPKQQQAESSNDSRRSMFDVSSSDGISEDAGNSNQTVSQELQQEKYRQLLHEHWHQQQQHTKTVNTEESEIARNTSHHHFHREAGPGTIVDNPAEGHRGGNPLQQEGAVAGMSSLEKLKNSYIMAVMMLDQKNGMQQQQEQGGTSSSTPKDS